MKFPSLPLYLGLAFLSFVRACAAQTPEELMDTPMLDTVVVTATGMDEEVFSVPYTVNVVDREDFLTRRAVRTLPEALAETPGIMIQKTSYGQASPFIRGFTGFRTLLLIDGIRLNNATFREGPNQYWGTIDILTIDRLEVVKGPSSVLYGSDAIGGTVNAITRSPEVRPVGDGTKALEFHPGAYYRYASAEASQTGRGELEFSWNPGFGMLGGVTYRALGDLRAGDGTGLQPNTGYSEIDGDLKLVYHPQEDIELTAAFQRVEQNNVPRTHSTIFAKGFDGTDVGTDKRRDLDQLRELAYLQLHHREIASWLDEAKFSFSFQRQEETQDRIKANRSREVTGFTDDQYGFAMSFSSPSPVGLLKYGVEYYHDEVSSFGRDYDKNGRLTGVRTRGPVANDASYDLLGLYLQDQIEITERAEIIAGIRYSLAHAQASKVDPNPNDGFKLGSLDRTFDAVTASLRGRFDVTDNWNFFGGVSQGFRAPNLSDFTSFELARSGEQETPAPGLDPEYYLSFELGTKARIDTEPFRGNLYAAYFYTLIQDQIIRYPTGRTVAGAAEVTKANVGDGYIRGFEFGADWNFYDGFTLFGNLTWLQGEVDTYVGNRRERRPSSRIQPLSGLVGLHWASDDERFWAEGTATLVRHQYRLSPGDMGDTQRIPPNGTGGYAVFALRTGVNLTPDCKASLAFENITNENYRVHGSGVNEPGRGVIVSMEYRY